MGDAPGRIYNTLNMTMMEKKESFNTRVEHCEAIKTIGRKVDTAFSTLQSVTSGVMKLLGSNEKIRNHLKVPFIRYINTDNMVNGSISVVVGYVIDQDIEAPEGFEIASLPAGRYAVAAVEGSYDQLLDANKHLQKWAGTRGLEFLRRAGTQGDDWAARYELYLVGQESTSDTDKWKTEIRYLLA